MRSKPIINLFCIFTLLITFSCKENKSKLLLPVYGDKKAVENDTIYHTVGNFELTNQYGEKVSKKTTEKKIYVADFFFATCQSICPEMSSNLILVQKAFEKDDSVLILSHSVNPMHDTVEVLNGYANTYHALKGKWHFLTGNKKQIYDLAKESYLVNALDDDGSEEGFLHSELFLLVDKKGRIRGMYDGTDKAEINKLIENIKLLKQEIE